MTREQLLSYWYEYQDELKLVGRPFEKHPKEWQEMQTKDFQTLLDGGKIWNHLFFKYTEGVS
jgi:hypothetical protein